MGLPKPVARESVESLRSSKSLTPTRRSHLSDRIFFHVTRSLAVLVLILSLLLVFELLRGSAEARAEFGIGFIWGTTWDPVAEQFSTLPTITGTLAKAFLSLLIAVPVSLGTAIFLAIYAPRWIRTPLSYIVESLASIPSVIIGLWGLFIMVPVVRVLQIWLKDNFGWFPLFSGPAIFGVGVLAAGIILAIMITPIIAAISRDVIRTVPRAQMEGLLALGATRWEAIWKVVLPYGRAGIIGAVILGLGRAVGETMAVTMVGGNAFKLVTSLFDPVHSMASQIASEFTEADSNLYVSSLIYVGLVLFAITVVIEIVAQLMIWRITKGQGEARHQA
ncbi:MAG: phosphate ABC transporter permease subunit PstC [SAR202 cluster bacterium]|nr:phosphate ABC transporter permease subunit PstC [SAR202 cluster bacterium]